MSFVSTFPTNIAKFSSIPARKISRDTASGLEAVVERGIGAIDTATGIEALVKPTSDDAVGLDRTEYLEIPVIDESVSSELATILAYISAMDSGGGLDASMIHRIIQEVAKGIENIIVYKALTLTPEDLKKAPTTLASVISQLLSLVAVLRRVTYGDYVLSRDVNQLVDAILLLDKFNQYVAYWFHKHGFILPQRAYDLVYEISAKAQRLFKVKAGDIIGPEPWNTITDILGEEYDLLRTFKTHLPLIPKATDIGVGIEASRRCELIRQFVSDTWDDTTRYWFELEEWGQPPGDGVVELDKPVPGAKRVFELGTTYYVYFIGFKIYEGPSGRYLFIDAYVGAYHGYNGTRAFLSFLVTVPDALNVDNSYNYPFFCVFWSAYKLGIGNGECCIRLRGYINMLNPAESYWEPVEPWIRCNRVEELVSAPKVVVLYGYEDRWVADWDQWACITKDSWVGLC